MACRLTLQMQIQEGFRKINTNIAIKFKVKKICFSQKLLAKCKRVTLFWGVASRCGFIYWVWSVGVAFVPEPVLKKLEPM